MAKEIKTKKEYSVREKIMLITNKLSIIRDGKNDFQGFKYFKPDDILRSINPLLLKYDLMIKFDMEYSKEIEMYKGLLNIFNDNGNILYKLDIPLTSVRGAGEAQNVGATMTYCKRYMIMNAFNIADNSVDPDNENNKPAQKTAKTDTKKADLKGTVAIIREVTDENILNSWKEKINGSNLWTDIQKKVILGNIKDRLEEIKPKEDVKNK